jgi:predicted porin
MGIVTSVVPALGTAQSIEQTTMTCSSDGARRHCAANTDAGVALQRSTGAAHCLLGRNWGYDAEGIWVTEGCGAEFVVGNSMHEQQRLAGQDPIPVVEPARTDIEAAGNAARSGEFSVYSRLGVVTTVTENEAQVQDNGSRLRFEYASRGGQRFFAAAEWAVNLTRTPSTINAGESTNGSLFIDESSSDVLGARLGYIGVDLGNYGTLTLGKQWGVYYDVTSYTDGFNAFGAEATATFNAGGDGGFAGTGRADGALQYRDSFFDVLDVGVQVQMRDLGNGEFFDGYGLSLRAHVTPRIEIGGAYNRARFRDELIGIVPGVEDDAEYRTIGVRYRNDKLTLSAVLAQQRDGDLARFQSVEPNGPFRAEVFDAEGVELFGRYQLGSIGVVAGFLHYSPELNEDNVLTHPSAERQYGIVGLDYRPTRHALLYAEYRAASGADFLGVPGSNVFVVGAKYEFADSQRFD